MTQDPLRRRQLTAELGSAVTPSAALRARGAALPGELSSEQAQVPRVPPVQPRKVPALAGKAAHSQRYSLVLRKQSENKECCQKSKCYCNHNYRSSY